MLAEYRHLSHDLLGVVIFTLTRVALTHQHEGITDSELVVVNDVLDKINHLYITTDVVPF